MILEDLLPEGNTATNRFPYNYDCKARVIPRRRKIWRRSGPRSTHHACRQSKGLKRHQSHAHCNSQLQSKCTRHKPPSSIHPHPRPQSPRVDILSEEPLPKLQPQSSQDQNLRHVKEQWATDPHKLHHQAQKMKAQDSVRDSRFPGSLAADTV